MTKKILNNLEIQQLIPHRYPFLLVDRIEDIVEGESCTGIKCVTINEPFFIGHFPGQPIMPGVLIIEALGQTAGALVCFSMNLMSTKQKVYFMSVEEAKFRRPVLPGDQLLLKVQKAHARKNVWKFKGEAYVGETLHASATYTAMIAE